MIDACIVKSPLWKYVKVLHLKQDMRSVNDEEFAEYIQCIVDGNESFIMDDLIKLPPSIAMQWEGQHSIYNFIDQVFPSLQEHANDTRYMVDRALLTPINDDVEQLNAKMISQLLGDEFTLRRYATSISTRIPKFYISRGFTTIYIKVEKGCSNYVAQYRSKSRII